MTDKETLAVYDAKAAEYADLTSGAEKADAQLTAFLDGLPAGASLWDLGCGPGRSAALMAAAGHAVLATDASAEMVALADAQPGVTARQETFADIAGSELYDGIWANFSLLHAQADDLPDHLEALVQALKPGGTFHIGMKSGEGTKRDGIGRRYTYVTEAGLDALLADAGLTVTARWTGADKGLDGVMAAWVVMQARKHA